jgi:hypothetical protein
MTLRSLLAAPLGALALAGCATTVAPLPAPTIKAKAPPPPGIGRVIGKTAAGLEALFGPADQDLREPAVRRLVFAGPTCVLDAYLYSRPDAAEPVVTWVDTRRPNGDDMDRAACIAALTRPGK